MLDNEIEGNLFNDYNWGGYLIWHLREYPVFVDGRTDLFGDLILNDYLEIMGLGNSWNDTLNAYEVGVILVKSESNLAEVLSYSNWKEVYRDDLTVVFTQD
jgi:hypothetical protein